MKRIPRLKFKCKFCGSPFERTRWDVAHKRHNPTYCSIDCRIEASLNHWNRKQLRKRLFGYRVMDVKTGCWLWKGDKGLGRHRQISVEGRNWPVSKVSLWVFKNVPKRRIADPLLYGCHHCDNPPCFNPNHIFLGTCAENKQDQILKGRYKTFNRTHCRNGHAMTEENIVLVRACRLCKRAWMADYRRDYVSGKKSRRERNSR